MNTILTLLMILVVWTILSIIVVCIMLYAIGVNISMIKDELKLFKASYYINKRKKDE